MLKPLGDHIIVKASSAEEVTRGGIVLPDTAKEKPQRAEVIAVGKRGLVNIVRGSLASPIGPDRCAQHGTLAGLSRAAVERMVDDLVEAGCLVRDEGAMPLLHLTPLGRTALAPASGPEHSR